MIIGCPTTRILGLIALIAASGCGSESGRPPVSLPAASSDRVPTAQLPAVPPVPPAGPGDEAIELVPATIPRPRRPFHDTVRAPAVATGDLELDPLVSYMKASFAAAIKDGHRLVIMDTTDMKDLYSGTPYLKDGRLVIMDTTDAYQNLVDGLLSEASDQVPAEMIRDFCEKNRESRAVWPGLTRHLPASLLTAEERKALFSVPADDVWKPFYAKYPGSPGIITVSRVGLNRDKTLAIFYVGNQRHLLLGEGRLHVLKKEGDVWVELPVAIGPEWIS